MTMNLSSMSELKDWVTQDDLTRYDGQADSHIRLDVTHSNLIQRWHDLSFWLEQTVGEVKAKLYKHGGTSTAAQDLYLRRGGDTIFMWDDDRTLRYYGAGNGMEIHIKDTDPHSMSLNGALENVDLVKKYEMPDEEYEKLANTVRAAKRKEQEAQRAAGLSLNKENTIPEEARPPTPTNVRETYAIGNRCEVNPGGRRGIVSFCGGVKHAPGTWIGITLDEPMGMNDGSVKEERYFVCGEKYGCFARIENVAVGDFPERDPFAELDEMDEDEI